MEKAYDIIVIGAGPAGSSAAGAAARAGASVLLIDRRSQIGVPVQCAEFVPQWVSRHAEFSSSCVLQTVETMVTHLPDGSTCEMRGPGYMLDRALFDRELAASAVRSGARISIQTRAVGLTTDGIMIERRESRKAVKAKVIIGADGVRSAVARMLGQPRPQTITALQYEVVIPFPRDHVDVFFNRDVEGGYAWFFPKGRTANVGLGVISRKAAVLPDLLLAFIEKLLNAGMLARVDIVGTTGGSVPCGPPQRAVVGNVLLAGDAAGHAHPITGAGILNAVIGGEMAGKIAAEAITCNDLHHLETYENEWRECFGGPLIYGTAKRQFLEETWNKPEIDFDALIRQTWVGFKEYHADRREHSLTNK